MCKKVSAAAAAAAAKASPSKKSAASPSKRTFKLGATRKPSPNSKQSPIRAAQRAVFKTHVCTFQKGDNIGEKTGNMQVHVRGSGPNADLHAGLLCLLLDQTLRFDDALKLFKARIHTKAQAAKVLVAMRDMYPGPNEDLPPSIDECEWNEETVVEVAIVPTLDTTTTPPTDIVLLDCTKGSLYPIKEKVKPFGFTYSRDFNGIPGADYWVAPAAGLDTEALAALLDDWGWTPTIFDGAD